MFSRGWEVEYKSGRIITEEQMDWSKISKNGIIRLTLRYDGREWNIHDKEAYAQKKRGSVVPGVSGSFMVESRSIGWYSGDKKVWYTVNEHTGKMEMTIEED